MSNMLLKRTHGCALGVAILVMLGLGSLASAAIPATRDKPVLRSPAAEKSATAASSAIKAEPAPSPTTVDRPKLNFPAAARSAPVQRPASRAATAVKSAGNDKPTFARHSATAIPTRPRTARSEPLRAFERIGRTGSGTTAQAASRIPVRVNAVSHIVVNDNWAGFPDSTIVAVGPNNYTIGRDAAGTIQRGLDLAAPNGKVDVLPGNYDETAAGRFLDAGDGGGGPYQFGLFFSVPQGAVTLEGVDELGNVITSAAAAGATITTNATNDFGTDGMFVDADGVTISGVIISTNAGGTNKTLEVAGDDLTLKNSQVNDNEGSIYFNDWRYDAGTNTSHIQKYRIQGNTFQAGNSVDLTSGAGYSGPASGRVITGNAFHGVAGETWPMVSFNGSNTGVPWFVYSVGGAVITGNTFIDTEPLGRHIRARGTYDNSQFDWTSYWNGNTYDRAVVVGPAPPANLRTYTVTTPDPYTFNDIREIASAIQPQVDHGVDGDKLLAKAGVYLENVIVAKKLTLEGANAGACAANGGARGPESVIDGNSVDAAIVIQSDDVTLDGFEIVHGLNGSFNAGVWMSSAAKNMTIQNNVVTGNSIGIYANCSDASAIACNLISSNNAPGPAGGTGIYSENTNKLNIHDNEITGHLVTNNPVIFAATGPGTHVDLQFVSNNVHANDFGIFALSITGGAFTGNTITTGGNATGLSLAGAVVNVNVKDNVINDNLRGVRVNDGGFGYGPNGNIAINHNDLVTDSDFGVGVLDGAAGYSGPGQLDATCNWWGSVSGPSGPANPTGTGSAALGTTNIVPWLNGSIAGAPACNGTFPVKNLNTGLTYPTIQLAIDAPQTLDGHTIQAGPATYQENVFVNKSVTLQGANAGACAANGGARGPESIIDGNFTGAAVTLAADGATLDGFEVIHGQNGGNAGVFMSAANKNLGVLNNVIDDNTIGIYANCSDASSIYCNLIKANNLPGPSGGAGIYSEYTNNLTVQTNELTGHTDNNPVIFAATGPAVHNSLQFLGNNVHDTYGVYTISIATGTFQNNTITTSLPAGATALAFAGACTNVTVRNNVINNSKRGVRIEDDGYGYGSSNNITVRFNDLVNDSQYGLGVISGYSGPGQLLATCNWWGSVSGPSGPLNPGGTGSQILGTTNFQPWLNASSTGPAACIGVFRVVNLTTSRTYPTIQQAIDAPQTLAGHIIFAPAGTYQENVVVNKGVKLQGNNAGKCAANGGARGPETIIDGNFTGAAVTLVADGASLDGFKVINGQNGGNAGVVMSAANKSLSVVNNVITNNTIGIYANCSDASAITCNLIKANNLPGPSGGSGIYSEYTNKLTVKTNEFTGHTDNNPVIFAATAAGVHKSLVFQSNNVHDTYGVYTISITTGTFSANTITTSLPAGATGLAFTGACTAVVVKDNFIKNNMRGVRVEDDGYGYGDNSNIKINHNDLVNDTQYGVGVISGYSGPGQLDATCNWWGSVTGPTTGLNPGGTGSPVTGTTSFHPWLNGSITGSPACSGTLGGSSVTVIFPNGGEDFLIGSDVKLVWSATIVGGGVPPGKVKLLLSRDNGATYSPIVTPDSPGGVTDNDGSLTWNVTGPMTTTALFRVEGIDDGGNTISDVSDATFTIDPGPTDVLLSRFDAEASDAGVTVHWSLKGGLFTVVGLERSEIETGPWLAVLGDRHDESGATVVVDNTAVAGRSYWYRLVATTNTGTQAVFGPVKAEAALPREFAMSAARPNPTTGPMNMEFSVARDARVRLIVLDLQGRTVATLAQGAFKPGRYQITWDGRSDRGTVPMGVYFVRFETPGKNFVQRVVLAR